jgi:ABC-type multidrug transport system ATPase subunit
VIEARNLTKRYGDTVAVNDLTFSAEPGSPALLLRRRDV